VAVGFGAEGVAGGGRRDRPRRRWSTRRRGSPGRAPPEHAGGLSEAVAAGLAELRPSTLA
jgi:hypothetical protein